MHRTLADALAALGLSEHAPPASVPAWRALLARFDAALWAHDLESVRLTQSLSSALAAETTERAAREQAEAANRAKDQFVASVSHELRTPMSTVLGMTQLLLETRLSMDQREALTTIHRSGETLLALVNEVLDYAKIEAGRFDLSPRDFDLRAAVDAACTPLRSAAARKGLAFECRMAPDAPRVVLGDALRLRQVITNLAGNAIKFTDKGGVEVRVERADDERVRVSVRDTGIGIAPEFRARLFQPFAQAGDRSGLHEPAGTGLGLSISRQIVELMGGEIACESDPGRGSVFWFTARLPAVARGASLVPPPLAAAVGVPSGNAPAAAGASTPTSTTVLSIPAPPGVLRLGGSVPAISASGAPLPRPSLLPTDFDQRAPDGAPQVLIVEDNDVNRLMAERMVTRLGYRCVAATQGRAALDLLAQGPYDAVLMDCNMPVLDGLQATRELRRREATNGAVRRTPVIAMTANAMPGDRERCLDAGMDDYLTKPISLAQLRAALLQWAPLPTLDASAPPAPTVSSPPRGSLPPASPAADPVAARASTPAYADPDETLDAAVLVGLSRYQPADGTDLISEVVGLFERDARERLAAMHEAVAGGDIEALRRAAHALKGACANVGARRAARMAERLEGASSAAVATWVEELSRELDRVFVALSALPRAAAAQ